MNYSTAESWLFSRRRLGMKYNLDRMQALMDAMGRPQEAFRTVHVVGTNGKGSTTAVLAALGRGLGLRVGHTTSPHLLNYRERINLDDTWIPEEEAARFVTDHRALIQKYSATFFEITTAMAAWYFAGNGAEWVIAEAGLGGRLDATRVYRGEATVFTGVQVEHSRILGATRALIAAEKVAVAEAGTLLVAALQTPDVEMVVTGAVDRLGLRRVQPVPVDCAPLPGPHQMHNGGLALAAASEVFGHPAGQIRSVYDGLCANGLKWPGRLDVRAGTPTILFDVAHNPESMEALLGFVGNWEKPVPAVIGFLSDKPWQTMVEMVTNTMSPVFAVTPLSERMLPADELAEAFRDAGVQCTPFGTIEEALVACRSFAGDGRMIVTGSFFVVGEAMLQAERHGWVRP
jgi:dihydrofolate synthase/folylpolyglutamate synthase